MSDIGSNRLPELAAQIRVAHSGVEAAAKIAATRAIEAGQALIEAKALLKHGQWLPWLREHCGLSERTAQLYMKIVRLGFKSETVADLGLKAAAGAIAVIRDPTYNVWAGLGAEEIREWLLFSLFGVHPQHVEWLRQREFRSPDEWLGEIGAECRRRWGMREPSPRFIDDWKAFRAEHSTTSLDEAARAMDHRYGPASPAGAA